jgi:hypothetical protein
LRDHRFIPRVFKRANIKRNEESGYPNRLKSNVTKTIVPKKRTNCLDDPGISPINDFFPVVCILKKSLSRKKLDKTKRSIPKQIGNIPVPAVRKVPIGILRERMTVIPPKRKITIPLAISFLLKFFS